VKVEDLKKKVAYLQGLAEGLDVSGDSRQGRIINGILDTLAGLSDALGTVEAEGKNLEEYMELVDQDLAFLEDQYYGTEGLDEGLVEIDCPACGEPLTVESEWLVDSDEMEITCPTCGGRVFPTGDEGRPPYEPENEGALTARKEPES